MARFFSILLRSQIHLLKPLIRSLNMEAQRKAQDEIGKLGAITLKNKIRFKEDHFACFRAEWAEPVNGCKKGVILYLHGGAYTSGCLEYTRRFGGMLANTNKRKTLCIEYRIAPENPFPAALDDAMEAYKRLLSIVQSKDIVIAGESAGGGLSFALALRLRDEGLPMPGCIVAISPWTDLTMSGVSFRTNLKKDPSLNEYWLRESVKMYCGNNTTNPYVSPLFGDLRGLPPCILYAGSREILLDDTVKIAKKLKDAGIICEDHIEKGMWHAYVLFGIREAKDALKRIAEFIDEHTNNENKHEK